MISYSQARKIIKGCAPLKPIQISSKKALGYTLAESIKAEVKLPHFANSAMDGFAVCFDEIKDASKKNPVVLPITGKSAAGDDFSTGKKGAWEIMTGAAIPTGYDSVVIIEDVHILENKVRFTKEIQKGQNIRLAGEDIQIGEVVLEQGRRIESHHLMLFIALGQKKVWVYPKPKITVLGTGKELVEDLEIDLIPGQIRNSNSPYLINCLKEMGYSATYGGLFADNPSEFEAYLKNEIHQSEIIISTGAVSAGKYDFIKDSLERMGAKILFHKVAIRPGKPILFAQFPHGSFYFGLPGNPISAAVGLRFFVTILLEQLEQRKAEKPIKISLNNSFTKKNALKFFLKADIFVSREDELRVDILDGQESFKMKPLLNANGWALIDEEKREVNKTEQIFCYPFIPNKWNLYKK